MVDSRNRKHYYLYIKSRGLAGIYIHIPFCRKACHYCNFHFSTTLKNIDEMVAAIIREAELRQPYLTEGVQSIYFGGGTPSLLKAGQIEQIIKQLNISYKTTAVREITLEANPEDISPEKVEKWLAAGINRVSLGIQTLDNKILPDLNRAHNRQQALEAIRILQKSGCHNLTIDLMYGLPGQTLSGWENDLQEIINLGIPHISSYALTIEPKTVFGYQEQRGRLSPFSDEHYEEQYRRMCELLRTAGFEHYEVSNFARSGYRSQHNQLYWQGAQYLGLGPGAHSFNGRERHFNRSNNATYRRSINRGLFPSETEILSPEQQYNEYLLTRLRTSAGADLAYVKAAFEVDLRKTFAAYFNRCISEKLAYFKGDNFILTENGFFLSDAIILELMKENHED